MSENTIYTLARTLQQTRGLEQDLQKMLSTLRSTVETEYLQKVHAAARTEKEYSVEHPPREVTLLRALSAFVDDHGKDQIDRMTQSLLFLHTMQQIHQNVQVLSDGNLLAARSSDGVSTEDLPSPQSVQLAGFLLALSLTEHF